MSKNLLKSEVSKIILEQQQIIAIATERIKACEVFLKLIGEESDSLEKMPSLPTNLLNQINNNESYPDYPTDEGLHEKLTFFNEIKQRVWSKNEFVDFVEKIEGAKSNKTLKHIAQKISYYLKTKELIAIKYSDGTKYTFYTTNKDWILNSKSKTKRQLKETHEPKAELLKGLSPEERVISWSGLD